MNIQELITRPETITEKSNRLIDIIHEVCGVDLMKRTRKEQYVSARMSYIKIMRDNGLGWSMIGRLLERNHATIIHNYKTFDVFVKHVPNFKENHLIIDLKFKEYENIYRDLEEIKLKTQVETLKSRIKELDSHNNVLKKQIDLKENKIDRLSPLIEILKERVPQGDEKQIALKLNRFFNGL